MTPPYQAPTVSSVKSIECTVDKYQKIPNGHLWRIDFQATLVGGRDWSYPQSYDGQVTGYFTDYLQSDPMGPSPYAPSTTTTYPTTYVIS